MEDVNATLHETFTGKPQETTVTISRVLQGELITLKQAHNIPAYMNSLEPCKGYKNSPRSLKVQGELQKHRIYVDDSGFKFYSKPAYGRVRQRMRVNRGVRGQRGNNDTVIVAISIELASSTTRSMT